MEFDQYCIQPPYCFFTWDDVVSSNLNENALPRKSSWRDCIKYGANPNWKEYLIFVSLCLYPLAISESGNIFLNNFPLPLAEANEKLEPTVLSACNIAALIIDSFDEKTTSGLVIVERLEGFNKIAPWFWPAFSHCKCNCPLACYVFWDIPPPSIR